MSECSKAVFHVSADADPSMLARVGDVLATLNLVPSGVRFDLVGEGDSAEIRIDVVVSAKHAHLLSRQLGRLILVHDVRVQVGQSVQPG